MNVLLLLFTVTSDNIGLRSLEAVVRDIPVLFDPDQICV